MATPTGTISISDLNAEIIRETEFEPNLTKQRSLGEDDVRVLAGKPTGPISFNDLRGKTWFFTIIVSSNRSGTNIRTLATDAGWDGTQAVQFIINSGVRIGPDTAALVSTGDFPFGLTVVNNGQIIGRGGNGGNGSAVSRFSNRSASSTTGQNGFTGVRFSSTTRLINNGQIAGGGGGGGGAASADQSDLGFGQRLTGTASSGAGGAGSGQRGSVSLSVSDSEASTLGGNGGITAAGTRAARARARARMDFGYATNSSTSESRGGAAGGLGAAGAAGGELRGDRPSASGGGSAGFAITQRRLITMVVQGTITGPIEN